MNNKQSQIVLIACLAIAALVAGSWFFLIHPQLSKASESRDLASQAQAQTQALQGQIADLNAKKAKLATTRGDYAKLEAQFPPAFKPKSWVAGIKAAASSSHVQIQSLEPAVPITGVGSSASSSQAPAPVQPSGAPGSEATPVGSSAVTITATGKASALRVFVQKLANMQRPLLIDTTSFSNPQGQSKASVTVSGRTFMMKYLPEPTAGASPSSAASPSAGSSAAG